MSQHASGAVIVSIGDTGRAGSVGTVIAALFALGGVAVLSAGGPIVIAVVLVGIAGLTGWFSLQAVRTGQRMDPGVLHVPTLQGPSGVFLLRSQVPVIFQRRVKRGSSQVQSMTARLLLQEFISYQVGTDRQTQTKDVWEVGLQPRPRPDPNGIAADLLLTFPAYPPTFDASSNKVRWFLIVDMTMADGFSEDSRFALFVAPTAVGQGSI